MERKWDILSRVSFLGWQRNLESIYDLLDVVCLTSLNEGTPVSLIEAQAYGRAVVATHVGGVEDIVFSGKNGYLIPRGDENLFVEKVNDLLGNEEKRKVMGHYGKTWVRQEFNMSRLIQETHHLYRESLREDL